MILGDIWFPFKINSKGMETLLLCALIMGIFPMMILKVCGQDGRQVYSYKKCYLFLRI